MIIEFVPKEDSQVKFLAVSKFKNYEGYDVENFEHSFTKYFDIQEKVAIKNSERNLYLMKVKD